MDAQPVQLNLLLENLAKIFERLKTVTQRGSNPKISKSANSAADNIRPQDQASVERLRKFLMGSGVPLEKMSISREGISSLKEFLSFCGFAKSDVDKLINGLLDAGKQKNGKINVLELFSKLSELKAAVDRKKKDLVLDASAIPYIEVALQRSGLNARHIEKVLSETRTANGDLNLESFLQSLKRIVGNTSPLHRATPYNEWEESIKHLFSDLGMEGEKEKLNGAISLDRFVQLLEESIAKTKKPHLPNQDVEKTIKRLIGEVVVDSKNNDSELQIKSRSTQKMIDELLGPKDPKGQQTGIGKRKNIKARGTHIVADKTGDRYNTQKEGPDSSRLAQIVSERTDNTQKVDSGPGNEKIAELLENRWNSKEDMGIPGRNKAANIVHTLSEDRTFTESIKAAQQHARPSFRSLPMYVVSQVSRQIGRSLMRGEDNIRLRLKPPHLGTVKLDMGMKGNVLKLNVVAESQATRELLLSHIQELKQSLIEQDIRLDKIDVHVSYQFGESMKDAQKEHRGVGHRTGGGKRTSSVLGIGNEEEDIDAAVSRGRMDAVLDLIA
ncbi:MAG: flagellar hook-length control protein FliK [Deltaproteobacteria bacterium]|nr:flagellar hook-length control protein FliK [Deltaproteobacteria bacterium]